MPQHSLAELGFWHYGGKICQIQLLELLKLERLGMDGMEDLTFLQAGGWMWITFRLMVIPL